MLASLIVFGGLIAHPGTRVFAENDDTSLFIWWFAHAADVVAGWFGLGSGERNLLYSTSMNHPGGVNGAWNTSVLGLALPMVPVTWLAGPVVAYNLCIIAAPVVSALAAARFIRSFLPRPPAFLGGFAYGFSTYLISQAAGHLNLAFAPFPPLVALGIVQLLRSEGRGATLRTAVWLGLVIGWQFYVSTELLAGTFLAAVTLVLCWALLSWRTFRSGLPSLVGGGVMASALGLLIGTPLLAAMFGLPGAPRAAIRPHGVWNNDVFDPVVPGPFTLLGGGPSPIPRRVPIDPSEVGGYVGIVWLLFAAAVVICHWRSARYGRMVRVAATTGILVWLLSMGSPWYFWGREFVASTPFRIVESMPVLANVLPMRLAVHSTLVLSLLLALGAWTGLRSRRFAVRRGTILAVIASLILVTPGAVHTRPIIIPEFYQGAYAEAIEPGAVVKTLPRPIALASPHADEAMTWQALTGMHYRETGGYFIGSTDISPVIYSAPQDELDRLLQDYAGRSLPRGSSAAGTAVAEDLQERGIDHVVIALDGRHLSHSPSEIARFVSGATGAPYLENGGVYIIDLP